MPLPTSEQIGRGLAREFRALGRSGFVPKASTAMVPYRFVYDSTTARGLFSVSFIGPEVVVQASFKAETATQEPGIGGHITFVEVVNLPRSTRRQAFRSLDSLVSYVRRLIPFLLRAVVLAERLAEF